LGALIYVLNALGVVERKISNSAESPHARVNQPPNRIYLGPLTVFITASVKVTPLR